MFAQTGKKISALFVVACLFSTAGCQSRVDLPSPPSSSSEHLAEISGGSMAPGLRGQHLRVVCDDCGYPFDFDAESPPQFVTCSNCGAEQIPVAKAVLQPADRVRVLEIDDRSQFKRFDVVAFKHPDRPSEFGVKRLVGFPKEQIEIRDGDLFVDGTLLRKSLPEQQSMAIPVYDDRYRAKNASRRWLMTTEGSDWQIERNAFIWKRTAASSTALDEIRLQTIRGYRGTGNARDASPVEDHDPYNQSTVRSINRVRDLAVEFDLELNQAGTISIAFTHLSELIRVELEFYGTGRLLNCRTVFVVGESRWPYSHDCLEIQPGTPVHCFVSVFDQQLLVVLDGYELYRLPIETELGEPTETPITFAAIGTQGTQIKVQNFRLLRDIYYLNHKQAGGFWKADPGSYVLLGDNAPISKDSRHWNQPCLASDLLGIVK
jgi:hypothetical protein